MPRTPNVKCIICGKSLYRRPFEMLKTNLFCCKEHRSELYKKFKNYNNDGLLKGAGWNKGKSIKNGDILNYAKPRSEGAKKNIKIGLSKVDMSKKKGKDSPIWKEVKKRYKKCIVCNKEFIARLTKTIDKNKHCSRKCSEITQRNNIKIGKDNHCWKEIKDRYTQCFFCKTDIIIKPCQIENNAKKFCSKNCQNKLHSLYMINTPPMIKTFDTNIEIIIENWLKENNIMYQKQFIIKDIACVDFFVEPNIVIQCDGDYWHSNKSAIVKDKWCNKKLQEVGYVVIRLLGSDILKGKRPNLDLFI